MSLDQVRIEFQANLDKVVQDFNKAIDALKVTKKATDAVDGSIEKLSSDVSSLQAKLRGTKVGSDEFKKLAKAVNNAERELAQATKEAKKFSSSIGGVKTQTSGLRGAMGGVANMVAGAFSIASVISFGKAVMETTAKFETLQTRLNQIYQSEALGEATFSRLQEFATKTPFQLDELVDGFARLAASGFKPTNDELMKLGDLASSKSKSFMQLSEALLDAQTFQFERLREFDITVAQSGDKLAFTFNGVTTEVNKTSTSVKDYILSLGTLEGVQGGMIKQSATLGGSISNLGDAWDNLLNKLGQEIKPILQPAIEGLTELFNLASKGEQNPYASQVTTLNEALTKQKELVAERKRLIALVESEKEQFDKVVDATARNKNDWSTIAIQKSKSVEYTKLLKQVEDELNKTNQLGIDLRKEEQKEADKKTNKAKDDAKKLAEESKKLADKKAKDDEAELKRKIKLTEEEVKMREDEVKKKQDIDKENGDRALKELKEQEDAKKKIAKKNKDIEDALAKQKATREEQQRQSELELEEAKERGIQELKNQGIEAGFQIGQQLLDARKQQADAEIEIERAKNQAIYDNATNTLNEQYNQGKISYEQYQTTLARINEAQAKREADLKRKQWIANRNAALTTIAINTATAVTKTFAEFGIKGLPLAGIVAASGAIQAGVVLAQPVPKFKKGGYTGKGGRMDGDGGFLAMLHPNEYVANQKQTSTYKPLFNALEQDRKGNSKPLESLFDTKPIVSAIREQRAIDLSDRTIEKLQPKNRPQLAK
jgi:hypothetical protein